MKKEKDLTPEEFIAWALQERARRTKSQRATIDVAVAVLHRRGKICERLFRRYIRLIQSQPW
jgi:hypothetical protein